MWLPAITFLLVLVMLVFMTTYLVTSANKPPSDEGHLLKNRKTLGTSASAKSQGLSTSKWVSAAGHVGGLCNASSPCLGHGQCVRDICRCDGPHLTVVAGVCQLATTAEASTASSEHVTPTSDLDNWTLPTVELFTHERTIRLVTDSATESDVAATDSDEEDIKARVEEVRADRRANRTKSSNVNHAQMWITQGSKERTQNQSSKRDATRSAGHPTKHNTSWGSTSEPTNRRASSTERSASGTKERCVNGTVGSKVERSTAIKPGRVRWTSVGPPLDLRRSTPLGGSANETTSGREASDTVKRRENRIAEHSPSQTTGHGANETTETATEGIAGVTRTEHTGQGQP